MQAIHSTAGQPPFLLRIQRDRWLSPSLPAGLLLLGSTARHTTAARAVLVSPNTDNPFDTGVR